MRPGYLHGHESLVPRFSGLGGGKADYAPPPTPPADLEPKAISAPREIK